MKRYTLVTLVVDDHDIDCKAGSKLEDIGISKLNFLPKDLEKYDLIIYQGSKGTKIIRSRYTASGEIKM